MSRLEDRETWWQDQVDTAQRATERAEAKAAELAEAVGIETAKRQAAAERIADLSDALMQACQRLEDFVQTFEGGPDPSENATKNLVIDCWGVLDTTRDGLATRIRKTIDSKRFSEAGYLQEPTGEMLWVEDVERALRGDDE